MSQLILPPLVWTSLRYENTAMLSLQRYAANMTWMVTIPDLQCESLRLRLVFHDFHIPLIMFERIFYWIVTIF